MSFSFIIQPQPVKASVKTIEILSEYTDLVTAIRIVWPLKNTLPSEVLEIVCKRANKHINNFLAASK